MSEEILKATGTGFNMEDYDQARQNFSWQEVEKAFSWYKTGKVNMAYEAIDRHAEGERRNKVALYYSDPTGRDEQYTFQEMKEKSNQAANLFKKMGINKGDRIFIFMPRTPELYFSLLGALKLGAVVGPLFEAFMEGAVKDRLENSEAVCLVTTPELLPRVPTSQLPDLKHVVWLGDKWIWPKPRRNILRLGFMTFIRRCVRHHPILILFGWIRKTRSFYIIPQAPPVNPKGCSMFITPWCSTT